MRFDPTKLTEERHRQKDTPVRGGRTCLPVELRQIATRPFAWDVGRLLPESGSAKPGRFGEFKWKQVAEPRRPANFVVETEGSA